MKKLSIKWIFLLCTKWEKIKKKQQQKFKWFMINEEMKNLGCKSYQKGKQRKPTKT